MLITKINPKSISAEAYRRLRTNIQYSSVDKKIKTILITSAEPAAGKSTTAANLAITFSEDNKKVLLIDCDLRKPSLHRQFKLSNVVGLTDVLVGKEKFEDTVNNYSANLNILTSGKIPPNPSEILGSNNMMELLNQLRKYYDIIIIDTAPLQAVTDGQILATKTDGTILLIKAESTRKDLAIEAKKSLDKIGANILGVVFNSVNISKNNHYGYYSYYGSDV